MALDCTVESTISALQIGGQHRLDLHGTLDGGLEQLLDAVLAQQAPESPDLGGAARQARLVIIHATEELPLHVLGPAQGSSSLKLKLFFRYSRLAIKRMGRRGRPAGLTPPPNSAS